MRVDNMLAAGLVDEVTGLLEKGYPAQLPAMSGIGYRQIASYLQGDLAYDDAVRRIKTDTHRYVRQQYNWFRLSDPRINWFDAAENPAAEITALIGSFLRCT
ncbi:tRNA (adenosine(37)-N6)-dimethylallyltransferase MiaA, partial [Chloroflexota bacterium]